VEDAMKISIYPVYVVVQDPSSEDEVVLSNYAHLITKIFRSKSNGRNIEELINSNRLSAWHIALIDEGHDYVVCLEDDVEISPDFFEFTEQVIEQNANMKFFRGINYGSFETEAGLGSYSRTRYGLHGPASLISKRTFLRFQLDKLQKLGGLIAWDSWVEPISKKGFMVTSNNARYQDNGTSGTHTSIEINKDYFNKLAISFQYGIIHQVNEYQYRNIHQTWRSDCVIYRRKDFAKYHVMFLVTRFFQYLTLFRELRLPPQKKYNKNN
jgi:GR25 family glycosyltransferase involved in LPS biosynthesis